MPTKVEQLYSQKKEKEMEMESDKLTVSKQDAEIIEAELAKHVHPAMFTDFVKRALIKQKPMFNAHRFNSAEDAYNACPKFCDIDVKTMTERELKIVEAVIKCFVWLYSPVEDWASA